MGWFKTLLDKLSRPPNRGKVHFTRNPIRQEYDGEKGWMQVATRIDARLIAIRTRTGEGRVIDRVCRVTKRETYQDFGVTCTMLDFVRTEYGFAVEGG